MFLYCLTLNKQKNKLFENHEDSDDWFAIRPDILHFEINKNVEQALFLINIHWYEYYLFISMNAD